MIDKDPTKSSPLPNSLRKLEPARRTTYKSIAENRRYKDEKGSPWFLIPESRWGPGQMLFSRLAKDLRICDVTQHQYKNGQTVYLSKEARPQHIETARSQEHEYAVALFFHKVLKDESRLDGDNSEIKRGRIQHYDLECPVIFCFYPSTRDRSDAFYTTRLKKFVEITPEAIVQWENSLDDLQLSDFDDIEGEVDDYVVARELLDILSEFKKTVLVGDFIQRVAESTVRTCGLSLDKLVALHPDISCSDDNCRIAAMKRMLMERVDRAINTTQAFLSSVYKK